MTIRRQAGDVSQSIVPGPSLACTIPSSPIEDLPLRDEIGLPNVTVEHGPGAPT